MKFAIRHLKPVALSAVALCCHAGPVCGDEVVGPTLKEAFSTRFLVGAALNERQFSGRDERAERLVPNQFNSITPENALKWASLHPEPGRYDFEAADRYVAYGEANDMFIVGHTLVWHSQTPSWVFQGEDGDAADRATLLARMRDHIHTVVGRYRGRVHGWDVVNEALNEDGSLRHSHWMKIIGEDYLEKAFEFAHEADPGAELYYNDYSLENPPKRHGAVRLVKDLQEKGIRVTGIGTQTHAKMDWPTTEQVEATLVALAEVGKVMVTELDIDVLPRASRHHSAEVGMRVEGRQELNPYGGGLPEEVQAALAQRYADLFSVYVEHSDKISRVTFWGVTDGDSWLNDWPVRGRSSYPLLFDREGRPKPAFRAVIETATSEPKEP